MAKTIELERLPVAEIRPNDWNPKRPLTDLQRAAMKRGVEDLGLVSTITVAPDPDDGETDYIVIDGEDRWRAALDSWRSSIDCSVLRGYTRAELKAVTIMMNEVRGVNDVRKRKALIREISDELDLDAPEIQELFALPMVDWLGNQQEPDPLADPPPPVEPISAPFDADPEQRMLTYTLRLREADYADLMDQLDALEDAFIACGLTELIKKIRKTIGWDHQAMIELGLVYLREREGE